ncbi:g3496 [Coccomyxa elongata]
MTAFSPIQLCDYLSRFNPGLAFCEPDAPVTLDAPSATPNDPLYPRQTNLEAIQVPAAWKTGQFGSRQVRVCVIDTGVDYLHPDLKANLWMNTAEMNGPGATAANGYRNGIDDDGDGIVDDIYGANFNVDPPTGDCMDVHGHGTHVSGVIGAVGNNALGIAGINQEITMVPCRFMDANGNGSREQAIKCMDWCLKQNVQILSNSWGEVPNSLSLQTAVATVAARGVVFVSSAGNDHTDNDVQPHWPSNLETDTTISVAALDATGALWSGSNYGNMTVDIAAPGVNVFSTYIGDGGVYSPLSGTSVAVPHVTGTAALLLSQLVQNGYNISTMGPNKGYGALIKKVIMQSVDPLPGGQVAWGSLNTAAALKKIAAMKPGTQSGAVADSAVTESSSAAPSPTPDLSSILGALATFGGGLGGNSPDGPARLDGAAGASGTPASGAGGAAGSQARAPPPSIAAVMASAAQDFAQRISGGRKLRSAGGLAEALREAGHDGRALWQ